MRPTAALSAWRRVSESQRPHACSGRHTRLMMSLPMSTRRRTDIAVSSVADLTGLAPRRPATPRSSALEHDGDALPDPDAHGCQPVAATASAQLPGEGGEKPGARAAERVPNGDRPAKRINDRSIELGPLGEAGDRLGGEGLVEFDHGKVLPTDARPAQGDPGGLDRSDAVPGRLDGGDGARDNPRQWLATGLSGRPLACQQQRRRAVVERRRVAGRHRSGGRGTRAGAQRAARCSCPV